eukprot:CAMPEP_0183741884 /NCGR_PEP_ID=MMETSP0737-20130205/63368_1 /TAXON_ID=385413 /ORGANISM="Thalassiosira miniscula, Strain CCMP1093" /LENGTH=233 /DNA_ID=CAMNT_0025977369 /DNA_START=89 /DNA_END=790 /DNA_ORIENTATION=-
MAPTLLNFIVIILVTVLITIQTCPVTAGVLDDVVPREKAKRPKLKDPVELPEVTHKVYFDVVISEEEPISGRITLGLFGNAAPKTVENFRSLCACDKGNGKISGKPLCYQGSKFHRIIPNFMIQGGDITENSGVGGESIYGGYFDDESFEVLHNKLYLLSMANKGPNTNGSQFFINTVKTSWLDNKNVVFGMVLSGFEIVDDIEAVGTNEGRPEVEVTIESSGELPISSAEDN